MAAPKLGAPGKALVPEVKLEPQGAALRMVWKQPMEVLGNLGVEFGSQLSAAGSSVQRVAVEEVPYHPLAMAGRYHTFRIASKFPVPGGAIEDDKKRRHAVHINVKGHEKLAAEARAVLERKAETHAFAAEMAVMRRSAALPWREYDELPAVRREKEQLEAIEHSTRLASLPAWPITESFPIGESDRFIFELIKVDDIDAMRRLFGRRDVPVDAADEGTLQTGLMKCAMLGREEMIKLYVEAGASVNKKSYTGNTALHYLFDFVQKFPEFPPSRKRAQTSLNNMVRYLTRHGADPTLANMEGQLPLHLTGRYNLAIAAQLLLDAGADPHATNAHGHSAIDIAQAGGCADVLVMLTNWESVKQQWRVLQTTKQIATAAAMQSSATSQADRVRVELNKRAGGGGGGSIGASGGSLAQKSQAGLSGRGLGPDPTPYSMKSARLDRSMGLDRALSGGAGRKVSQSDVELEERLPAAELIERWGLLETWVKHRQVEDSDITHSRCVAVADYDMKTGALQLRRSPEKSTEKGDVVAQSRRLAVGDAAGRGVRWFDPGQLGSAAITKEKRRAAAQAVNDYDDDAVSVEVLTEGDGESSRGGARGRVSASASAGAGRSTPGSPSSRPATSSKYTYDTNDGAFLSSTSHNTVMGLTMQRQGASTSPPPEMFGLMMRDMPPRHPTARAPPPSRMVSDFLDKTPAERRALERSDARNMDRGHQQLMVDAGAIEQVRGIAEAAQRRLKNKHYRDAVTYAIELDPDDARHSVASQSLVTVGADTGTPRPVKEYATTLTARRRAVVSQVLGDIPSIEYNRRNTHVVAGSLVTRRPAVLSATLKPARFRLDNRDYAGGDGSGADDPDNLERMVVGIARNAHVETLRSVATGAHVHEAEAGVYD